MTDTRAEDVRAEVERRLGKIGRCEVSDVISCDKRSAENEEGWIIADWCDSCLLRALLKENRELSQERDEAKTVLAIALAELCGYQDGFEGMPNREDERPGGFKTSDEAMAYHLWFGKGRKERVELCDAQDTLRRLLEAAEARERALREALIAAQQFLPPDIPRGRASNGWQNTVDMVDAALASPVSPAAPKAGEE